MTEAMILLNLILNVSITTQKAAAILQKALAEGRDVTPEERKSIDDDLAASQGNLHQAIAEQGG